MRIGSTQGSAAALAELIRDAGSVVALTGAGISVPSGIPDFRTPGKGLWEKVDPMEVAHIDAFHRDTQRFWQFYRPRFADLVCPSLGNLEKGLTHVPPGDLSRCDCLRRDFVKGGPQHRDGERPSHISLWVRQQLPADPPLQEFLTAAGQSGTLPAVPC